MDDTGGYHMHVNGTCSWTATRRLRGMHCPHTNPMQSVA